MNERIRIIEDTRNSNVAASEVVAPSGGQKAELDRRLEAYRRNPDEGSPWEAVRERIRSRK